MNDAINSLKERLIQEYFKDNPAMQDVVHRAFNGEACAQEVLAEWFDANDRPDIAQICRERSATAREKYKE